MRVPPVSSLALMTTVFAVATMALGSYVSKVGAGLACPDWPLCPIQSDPFIVLEFTHRIIAFTTFVLGLATFVQARKKAGTAVGRLVSFGFATLFAQVFIVGALVIFTALPPLVVAVHQAVAGTVVAFYAAGAAASWLVTRKKLNRPEEAFTHG
ncbi:MAG: COX15/CtaA family protein [Candidatus Caldarchaeum sp.]|uniref:Cytochrome oxidase assembly protein n=1 Tax=Caldiarchaeum subterraneum TaxID=311458 RepID=A0A7C5QJ31_CALS0